MAKFLRCLSVGLCGLLAPLLACHAMAQTNIGRDKAAESDETAARGAISDAVAAAVLKRDFTTLAEMEKQFVSSRSRTPSGIWNIAVYFTGFSDLYVDSPCASSKAIAFAGDWIAARPKDPAAYILKAEALMYQGWCIRGEDVASKTSDKSMREFHKYAVQALSLFDKNLEIVKKDPRYFVLMIKLGVILGFDRDVIKELLQDMAKSYPGYQGGYLEAVDYFRLKWHGESGDMDRLGRLAMDLTKEEGAGIYARIFWEFQERESDDRLGDMDRTLIMQGMSDVQKAYPTDWNAAHFARIACRMDDPWTAFEYIKQLSPDAMPEWRGQAFWEACKEGSREVAENPLYVSPWKDK